MKLYTTPPSIPTLMTWVPQSRPLRMVGWPSTKPNPTVCSPACHDRPCGPIKSLLILSPACIPDGRAWLYSSELSYSAVVLDISSTRECPR